MPLGQPSQVLLLNQISANGWMKRTAGAAFEPHHGRGDIAARRRGRAAGALGRHARDGHPAQRAIGRGRWQLTTSRQGHDRGVPVFNAGCQCQRRQGAGAGRHVDGGAQPAAALRFVAALDPTVPTWKRPSEDGKKNLPAMSWPGHTGHHRVWARSAAWSPTPPSSWHERAGLRPGNHGDAAWSPARR